MRLTLEKPGDTVGKKLERKLYILYMYITVWGRTLWSTRRERLEEGSNCTNIEKVTGD